MKHVLFFMLLCAGIPVHSQTVNEIVNNCMNALEDNDLETLRKEYSTLYLQLVREVEPNYINAVRSVRDPNYKQAFISLHNLISEGYMLDEIREDNNFAGLHVLDEWGDFTGYIDSITAEYNNELRRELNRMQYEDQGVRLLLLNVQKSKGRDDPAILSIRREMKETDAANAVRVQQIIDRFGWLGEREIGSEASQTLFLTIQHVDDLIVQQKYMPVLEQAVKAGNAEAWEFAFLTDRILMNQGKFQVYGTQVILSENSEDSYIVPLQNPEEVDELRRQVGLEPLNDYLQEEGLEWNIEKYRADLPRILERYKNRNSKDN
ncbi:MAG: hypothetical protein LBJ58_05945 [Tannerellaceae bacterium]|jgi:hypothetical protein|nr:hypothetical protein [Tannerellaceae bacterium]